MMSFKKLVFAETQFSQKLRFNFIYMTIPCLMKRLDYPMTSWKIYIYTLRVTSIYLSQSLDIKSLHLKWVFAETQFSQKLRFNFVLHKTRIHWSLLWDTSNTLVLGISLTEFRSYCFYSNILTTKVTAVLDLLWDGYWLVLFLLLHKLVHCHHSHTLDKWCV